MQKTLKFKNICGINILPELQWITLHMGDTVVLRVEHRTSDQKVAGSTPACE